MIFFLIALTLVLFTDLRLSIALFVGALGMIVTGVLKIEEAYEAISWKSVFLLASLIPLGLAVETTGTAAWIAQQVLSLLGGVPTWVLQAAIARITSYNVCYTKLLRGARHRDPRRRPGLRGG